MKALLLAAGLLTVFPVLISSDDDKCHFSQYGKCIDIGIEWFKSLKGNIVQTDEQIETMCIEIDKWFKCGQKFQKSCMSPLMQDTLALYNEGEQIFMEEFCHSKGPIRKNYLKHASCLNKAIKSKEMKEVFSHLMNMAEKFNDVPNERRLNYTCCAYRSVHDSIFSIVLNICGEDALKTIQEVMNLIFAQLPDVLCSSFAVDEPECILLLPTASSKPTENAMNLEMYKNIREIFGTYMERRR